jgi:carboxyl-terminal processing protease
LTPRKSWALLALLLPVGLGAFALAASPRLRQSIELFNQVYHLVSTTAVDSLSEADLYERAARGLIRELNDPYAALMSPKDRASFERNSLGNRYAGTGMTIRSTSGKVTAYRVFPGSPASKAGLHSGDRLLQVNDVLVTGLTTDSVSAMLLGTPGAPVQVSYQRAGEVNPVTATIERAVIRLPAVPYAMILGDNVGYIPLQRFNDVAAVDVARTVLDLQRRGARSFILDVRGNGGGDLFQSLRIASLFLEKGLEVASVRHRGKPAEVYRAEESPLLAIAPMVVLVDGNSASASEIVAGSLQDQDRALVIGTRTFGKGLVQTQSVLANGWAVRLTTGKWYTPSGRSIQAEHEGMSDSRFVDSTAAPIFRSAAGRPIVGGGGVTPDLVVTLDTVATAERVLARAVGNRVTELQDMVFEVARELAVTAGLNFTVQPAWRDSLFARVLAAEIPVTRSQFDDAHETIDRLLDAQVAGLIAGDSAAFHRRVDTDRALQEALLKISNASDSKRLLGLN